MRIALATATALLPLLTACSRLEPALLADDCRHTEVVGGALLPERVKWTKAREEGDHAVLDRWCETVGPAVFRARPAVEDSLPIDSIAIVSWNTHVGGGDIERFVRDLRSGRFTKGDSVRHFVLLLQEVYRVSDSVPALTRIATPSQIATNPPGGKRRDVVATANTLGLSLLYVPSMRNGQNTREDRGNAVLSTLPLEDPGAIDLPYERQRRVVATARLKGKGSAGRWDTKVASVHFDNRSTNARIAASVGPARYRQAYALAEALKGEERIVVAGDFNTWGFGLFEKALPLLRAEFEDSPPAPEGITYVKGKVQRRIDYMFFRLPDGWTARYDRIGTRYGSDHHPLLGWLRY